MNILTFDIEDWYNCDFISGDLDWSKYEVRIYDGVSRILNALDERGILGTFFCLGWLADNHPKVIQQIIAAGHQVGCHSYQHQLATSFTIDEFYKDTLKAKSALENVLGSEVTAYRAPGFSITKNNLEYFDVLSELGFQYDCSVFPAPHDYGGIPTFGKAEPKILKLCNGCYLKEFPINTTSIMGKNIVFSGGGFFRIMPYHLIQFWAKKSEYMMTYFHPRDFDYKQPRMRTLPTVRYFKSYVGIKSAFSKFEKLLDDFNFVNVVQADEQINWEISEVINVEKL